MFDLLNLFDMDCFKIEASNEVSYIKKDKEIILDIDLHGYPKKGIKVQIDHDFLYISAETVRYGKQLKFSKVYTLGGLDAKNIVPKYENGILSITIFLKKPIRGLKDIPVL